MALDAREGGLGSRARGLSPLIRRLITIDCFVGRTRERGVARRIVCSRSRGEACFTFGCIALCVQCAARRLLSSRDTMHA